MKKIILFLSILVLVPTNLKAFEKDIFLSLKYNKVNVRQGPGFNYPVKFVYTKKYIPLKVIDSHENFKKIIDFSKNSGWVHYTQLSKKRSAINIKNNSIIFKKPEIYSKPLARIEIGKLIIIKKCKKLWCKINANEFTGWIKKEYLWGKVN